MAQAGRIWAAMLRVQHHCVRQLSREKRHIPLTSLSFLSDLKPCNEDPSKWGWGGQEEGSGFLWEYEGGGSRNLHKSLIRNIRIEIGHERWLSGGDRAPYMHALKYAHSLPAYSFLLSLTWHVYTIELIYSPAGWTSSYHHHRGLNDGVSARTVGCSPRGSRLSRRCWVTCRKQSDHHHNSVKTMYALSS